MSAGNAANDDVAVHVHVAVITGFVASAKPVILPVMSRELVHEICAALPGAEVSDPFGGGHDTWKLADKIFALVDGAGESVITKCPDVDTAEMLKEVGLAQKAPYFHKSWVLLPFDRVEPDELRHRILTSYELIRSKLPKKVRDGLGPVE